nr:hypothetical protein [Rhodopirellula bahusiensis]
MTKRSTSSLAMQRTFPIVYDTSAFDLIQVFTIDTDTPSTSATSSTRY